MEMPGRKWTAEGYRYGFNGKENDKENNEGSYDFGARIYDSRLGRWWSTEPHYKIYPGLSPYQFSNNSPILFNDVDGKDGRITIIPPGSDGSPGKIIIETVVHLFGNVPKGKAEQLNKDYSELLGTIGEFIDATNAKWSIEVNITFSQDNVEKINIILSEYMNELTEGEMYGIGNNEIAIKENLTKEVKNFIEGDIIMFLGACKNNTGRGSFIGTIGSPALSTYIHEALHALGFEHFQPNLSEMGSIYSQYHEILEGSPAYEVTSMQKLIFHPFRYNQIVNFAMTLKLYNVVKKFFSGTINEPNSKASDTKTIDDVKKSEKKSLLKRIIDKLKGSGNRYQLKNPKKPKKDNKTSTPKPQPKK